MRKTPLRPSTKRMGVNRARKASELLRAYGPPERRKWVKAQPCCICGALPSENMHVRTSGIGYKADYVWIVPACRTCHRLAHSIGIESFQDRYGIDLWRMADRTEAYWQAYLREHPRRAERAERP